MFAKFEIMLGRDDVVGLTLNGRVKRHFAFTLLQTFQRAPAWCLRPDVRLEVSDQPSCDDFRASSDCIDNFLFPPGIDIRHTEEAV